MSNGTLSLSVWLSLSVSTYVHNSFNNWTIQEASYIHTYDVEGIGQSLLSRSFNKFTGKMFDMFMFFNLSMFDYEVTNTFLFYFYNRDNCLHDRVINTYCFYLPLNYKLAFQGVGTIFMIL